MGVIELVEEMQKKAGSYDALLDEYNRLRDAIKDAISRLESAAFVTADMPKSKRNGGVAAMVEKIYNKMKTQDNYQVTIEILMKEFAAIGDNADNKKCNQVMYYLSKLDGVKKSKDGGKARLFYFRAKEEKEPEIKFGNVSVLR